MSTRLNNNTIRVPFTTEENMEVVSNFIIGNNDPDDEVVIEHLGQLASGFILTSAIITLIAQIGTQLKLQDKKANETQIQQLDSIKHYNRVLTKNKDIIFFRNCLAVTESILVTIGDYTSLSPAEKRDKFLEEVDSLNNQGIPARLLVNPNKENINIHRKGMSLRIRSSCQADPIYKMNSIFTTSKSIWDRVIPERFVNSFEQYTNVKSSKVIDWILSKEESKDIDHVIADKLYFVFDSNEVKFNESIGVNTVPFETRITQTYEKNIVRSKSSFTPIVPDDFKDPNDPLGKLLNLQKQKLSQPGGLKSNRRRKK